MAESAAATRARSMSVRQGGAGGEDGSAAVPRAGRPNQSARVTNGAAASARYSSAGDPDPPQTPERRSNGVPPDRSSPDLRAARSFRPPQPADGNSPSRLRSK